MPPLSVHIRKRVVIYKEICKVLTVTMFETLLRSYLFYSKVFSAFSHAGVNNMRLVQFCMHALEESEANYKYFPTQITDA